MKIKTIIFIASITIILSGLTTIMFVAAYDNKEAARSIDQNQVQVSEVYTAASLSKGTILLLLAVGIVGALGVSRTKKSNGSPAQRDAMHSASDYENANEERQKLIPKSS